MDSFVFSYYITEINVEIEGLNCKRTFGKYTMHTDFKTPSLYANNGNDECIIFGYAVNVFTKESDNLAEVILSKCSGIEDVIEYEKQLGGKYIILSRFKDKYYLIGDATCSIPIFYSIDGHFACASNMQYLVNEYGYTFDHGLLNIRLAGDISQAMPYDITQYKSIRQLLPNHFLAINERKIVRYINADQNQELVSVNEATERVAPLIDVICDFYNKRLDLLCPITSGRDSRVVLSFLASCKKDINCYTIKHPEHDENSQDLIVPQKICRENHMAYEQIQDSIVPKTLIDKIDLLLGKDNYSLRTLRIAHTIHEHYGNSAIINGDIIGQVGKCSLHRDIPMRFATPSYFRCKLHNYSKESKKQLALWLEEIKSSGECVNTFDLFQLRIEWADGLHRKI